MQTITTAGAAAALFSLGIVVLTAGGEVSAHHRAQVAADLSAVAGAVALHHGEDACRAAGEVAVRNGASISSCVVAGRDVTATAAVKGREVTATAGPV